MIVLPTGKLAEILDAQPRRNQATNLCLFAAVVLSTVALILIGEPLSYSLLQENGVIETASALGYLLCIGLVVVLRPTWRLSQTWPFVVILAAMFLRELDMDKSAFTLGLLKSRQYTSDAVPLPEKLISIAILLLIISSVIIVMKRHGKSFFNGVIKGRSHDQSIGLGISFALSSKLVDGLNRKLSGFNFQVSAKTESWLLVYEEIAELGIAFAFALAILTLKKTVPIDEETQGIWTTHAEPNHISQLSCLRRQ